MAEKQRSLYSQLKRKDAKEEEKYHGIWQGESIEFKRNFRGHRFTDEECQALCRGENIEVHNIEGKYGVYAVQGHLTSLNMGFYTLYKFDAIDTVPNKPDFKYGMPLFELHSYTDDEDAVVLDDSDLTGIEFEESYESSESVPMEKSVNEPVNDSVDEDEISRESADAALSEDDDVFVDVSDESDKSDDDKVTNLEDVDYGVDDWLDDEDLFSDKAIEAMNAGKEKNYQDDDFDELDEEFSSVFVVPLDDV